MNNEQQTDLAPEADPIVYVTSQPGNFADYLSRHLPKEYVGFKAPVPWDGWTDAERRKAFGGFLYPSWHPFAVLEGNHHPSSFADVLGFRSAKVQGEVDESIEERKKQFAIPMTTKKTYGRHSPVGTLKRK
jgi:hypothetical protein